jgi:hypothetical protein
MNILDFTKQQETVPDRIKDAFTDWEMRTWLGGEGENQALENVLAGRRSVFDNTTPMDESEAEELRRQIALYKKVRGD